MEKIAIFTKKELSSENLLKKILKIKEFSLDESNPDYVFTFGGDGTFLDAVHKYGVKPTYIPINMGNLGFYTSWEIDELEMAVKSLEEAHVINLNPIEVDYTIDNKKYHKLAVNEVTIINPINTQILEVLIDDVRIEKFRGTGVCLSTTNGSTAYNKSLGGAIVHSNLELIQYTKIAPINNRIYRSLDNSVIIGKDSVIKFCATLDEYKNSILTVDRFVEKLEGTTMVEICLSKEKIKLLVRKDNNFWLRVRKSFL